MVSHRSSKKKQQTRLSFTPLPSSSPAATDLPEHTQTRIANVRYDLMASPTKKRRLAPPSSGTSELGFRVNVPAANDSTIGGALPTPEPSSQIQAGHEDAQVRRQKKDRSFRNNMLDVERDQKERIMEYRAAPQVAFAKKRGERIYPPGYQI
ncbi:MAG: hypothetical protein Q9188_005215 [Gyalolechia gomerana]